MRNCSAAWLLSALLLVLVNVASGQEKQTMPPAKEGVLKAAEVGDKLFPDKVFFRGQSATVQARNSAGVRYADGFMVLTALVDASGYSTAVQQKYQGLLITETKLNIGGSELPPGQYGFGFTADGKFGVMDVADNDVVSSTYQTDEALKRPVPLKLLEDGEGYKLYAGRKWIAIKAQ